jgi:transposase
MFIIGVDPHRGSHAAVVIDDREQICDELAVVANRHQRDRLMAWASRYQPRLWAIEGATGTGALLAQQLVAAGECVVDVPPTLAARVRLLDNEQRSKTDRHDARSAARSSALQITRWISSTDLDAGPWRRRPPFAMRSP